MNKLYINTIFVYLNLFLLHGLLRRTLQSCVCVSVLSLTFFFFFCLLFVYIVTSIYERTLDVASFSSLKLRIGGCSSCLFLFKFCLFTVFVLFCLPQHVTRRVVVYLLRLLFCLHFLCIITTFIRFCWFGLQVCEWVKDDASLWLCVCFDRFNEEIEQVKKNKLR